MEFFAPNFPFHMAFTELFEPIDHFKLVLLVEVICEGAFFFCFWTPMLVQGLNSLHQISECVCISLWHMAYKELFEPIDASISIWCVIIWI